MKRREKLDWKMSKDLSSSKKKSKGKNKLIKEWKDKINIKQDVWGPLLNGDPLYNENGEIFWPLG